VIKKDGSRESFDRRKIIEGMRRACEKRSVSIEKIEAVADLIEQELMEKAEKEVSSKHIGGRVMEELREMDDVAYVRFASVYRSFRDIEEFVNEIKELYEQRKEAQEQQRAQEHSPTDVQGIQDSPRS